MNKKLAMFSKNNDINNILTLIDDGKRSNIRQKISFKDIYHIRNFNTTAGSRVLKNHKSSINADIVKWLKPYFKIISKDNLDEFAVGERGYSSLGGQVIDGDNIGGSSTGTSYNVENDISDLGIGSDTGGSVRDITFNRNIIGFKPSWGLISRFGMIQYCPILDTVSFISKKQNLILRAFLISLISSRKGCKDFNITLLEKWNSKPFDILPKNFNLKVNNKSKINRCYASIAGVYLYSNLQRYYNKKFNGATWWFKAQEKGRHLLFTPAIKKRYLLGLATLKNPILMKKIFNFKKWITRLINLNIWKWQLLKTPVREYSKDFGRNWGLELANLTKLPAISMGNTNIMSGLKTDLKLLRTKLWK